MSFQRRLESSIFNAFLDSRFHGNDSLLKLSAPKPQDGGEEFVSSPLQREKDRACPELDSGMRVNQEFIALLFLNPHHIFYFIVIGLSTERHVATSLCPPLRMCGKYNRHSYFRDLSHHAPP